MKVALCLHGYFSSLQDRSSLGSDGYQYIKKHILSKVDTDVFIHNWEPDKKDLLKEVYKPKDMLVEEQIDFSAQVKENGLQGLPNPPRKPTTILSHFYSIQKVFELCYKSSKDYDVIIKSRFDLGRINRNTSGPGKRNPYPVQCINFNPSLDMSRLYMAHWDKFDEGPADMWFYSSKENMSNFTTIYDDIAKNMTKESEFGKKTIESSGVSNISNAVLLYKWWFQKTKLWNIKESLDCQYE